VQDSGSDRGRVSTTCRSEGGSCRSRFEERGRIIQQTVRTPPIAAMTDHLCQNGVREMGPPNIGIGMQPVHLCPLRPSASYRQEAAEREARCPAPAAHGRPDPGPRPCWKNPRRRGTPCFLDLLARGIPPGGMRRRMSRHLAEPAVGPGEGRQPVLEPDRGHPPAGHHDRRLTTVQCPGRPC